MAAPWGRQCSRNRGISPIIVVIYRENQGQTLSRGQCLNGQRVNIVPQHLIDRGVHQPMTGNRGDSAERLGDNADSKMAAPIGGAGMAGMQVAFILDIELAGGKTGYQ
jgi:hypothetical protein